MLRKSLNWLKLFLERLDKRRDQLLFYFIQKFWPRWLVPNYLTYIRLIIGILLFVLLFYYGITDKFLIIILFTIGILTDLFDGSVARCLKMESKFGAFIDPPVDRLLIIPIAVYSLVGNHNWLLLILIILEVISGLISAFAISRDVNSLPNIFGKTKMVLQSIAFGLVLIMWPKTSGFVIINILWVSVLLMIFSIFMKVLEIYSKLNIKNLANKQIKLKKYENKTSD